MTGRDMLDRRQPSGSDARCPAAASPIREPALVNRRYPDLAEQHEVGGELSCPSELRHGLAWRWRTLALGRTLRWGSMIPKATSKPWSHS